MPAAPGGRDSRFWPNRETGFPPHFRRPNRESGEWELGISGSASVQWPARQQQARADHDAAAAGSDAAPQACSCQWPAGHHGPPMGPAGSASGSRLSRRPLAWPRPPRRPQGPGRRLSWDLGLSASWGTKLTVDLRSRPTPVFLFHKDKRRRLVPLQPASLSGTVIDV